MLSITFRIYQLAVVMAVIVGVAACNLAAGPAAWEPWRALKSRPWKYVYGVGVKIRSFMQYRGQLKLVVIGDSRASVGGDTREFYLPENSKYPVALNLTAGVLVYDIQKILLNEYVVHAPKLEYVLWQISARLFNRYYQDMGIEKFKASPGYRYDQQHKGELWGAVLKGPLSAGRSPTIRTGAAWGYSTAKKGRTDPKKISQLIKSASLTRYEFDQRRWRQFEAILKACAKRNVRVMGFISPMHYGLALAPAADDDGTGDAAYWALMEKLERTTRRHSNFYFLDLHKDGRNDFTDDEYLNWDHLNPKGAAKLTRILVDWHRRLEAQ